MNTSLPFSSVPENKITPEDDEDDREIHAPLNWCTNISILSQKEAFFITIAAALWLFVCFIET